MSTNLSSQIITEVDELPLKDQQRVLEFVRSLKRLGPGMSAETLRKYIGVIEPEEARLMREAIEEGCEQVDMDGW